jgi:hypothetical protein
MRRVKSQKTYLESALSQNWNTSSHLYYVQVQTYIVLEQTEMKFSPSGVIVSTAWGQTSECSFSSSSRRQFSLKA